MYASMRSALACFISSVTWPYTSRVKAVPHVGLDSLHIVSSTERCHRIAVSEVVQPRVRQADGGHDRLVVVVDGTG